MATPPRKASTGQLNSNTHCSLWSVHTRKQSNSLAVSSISEKVGTRCRSPFYERFVEGCSSPFLRPRRTPHGASRLVRAMPACLVKTRRAPSRHSKEARVYGHTTTVMHNLSTPPPPPPPHANFKADLSSTMGRGQTPSDSSISFRGHHVIFVCPYVLE